MRTRFAFVLALVALLALPAVVAAEEGPAAVNGQTALSRLRAMEGEWAAESPQAGGKIEVDYRVTGNGTAVVETLFKDTEHEMVTVYYVEGEELVGTHYCSQGNQPHFRLDRTKSTATDLVLRFDGGTNIDPAKGHIDGARFTWKDDGSVVADWHHRAPAGKDGGSLNFTMRRK